MKKVIEYVKSAAEEVKKVQWPNRKETMRLTAYVIGASLGVGLFVTIIDYFFKEILGLII